VALAEPAPFVAVTTERIVKPTSLACSVYVLELAPAISEQMAPDELQSSHAYE
jgi:hypothetical protein